MLIKYLRTLLESFLRSKKNEIASWSSVSETYQEINVPLNKTTNLVAPFDGFASLYGEENVKFSEMSQDPLKSNSFGNGGSWSATILPITKGRTIVVNPLGDGGTASVYFVKNKS